MPLVPTNSCSKKARLKLESKEKARVNKPLTAAQKRFNRLIAKIRYKVEQGFRTLKKRFKFTRASYFTAAKVRCRMVLKALAFNQLKGLSKINLTLRSTGQLRPV